MHAQVSFSLTACRVTKQSSGKAGFVYSSQPLCGRDCSWNTENVKIYTLTDLWPTEPKMEVIICQILELQDYYKGLERTVKASFHMELKKSSIFNI